MTKRFAYYPNCSMGGMSTVLRDRTRRNPEEHFTFLFSNDAGGRESFRRENTSLRITPLAKVPAMVEFASLTQQYDEMAFISSPTAAKSVHPEFPGSVVYEFHTSDQNVIEKEAAALVEVRIDQIRVPSAYARDLVTPLLSKRLSGAVRIVPNTVDTSVFSVDGPAAIVDSERDCIPLLWVGRLDKGKNPNDALRLLQILPQEYRLIMVLSLEAGPTRLEQFLGLASMYGVAERVSIRLDLPQLYLAELKRGVRDRAGWLLSTSLSESFGYTVLEAAACGLRSVAYEVGALGEHITRTSLLQLLPVGDVRALAEIILKERTVPELDTLI